jgi:hypothetical protein
MSPAALSPHLDAQRLLVEGAPRVDEPAALHAAAETLTLSAGCSALPASSTKHAHKCMPTPQQGTTKRMHATRIEHAER